MSIPRGSRVDGDTVDLLTPPWNRVLTAVAIAILLFIAIGMPIDQAREGRLATALVGSAICVPCIAALVWYLGWGSRMWMVRIDGEGVHRRLGRAVARWEDIADIEAGPTTRIPIRIVVPSGLVRPDGARRGTALWIRASYFAGSTEILAYLRQRWALELRRRQA